MNDSYCTSCDCIKNGASTDDSVFVDFFTFFVYTCRVRKTLSACILLIGAGFIHSSEPYLLFSTWFTVSRMKLDGSDYTVLVDSLGNVGKQAVDYHLGYIYTDKLLFVRKKLYISLFPGKINFIGVIILKTP